MQSHENKTQNKVQNKIHLRDVILGGQDGLVNVLGLSMGLYASHASARIIIVAGLAAGFSEAVSMGAVVYTSSLADKEKLKKNSNSQLIFMSGIVAVSALLGSFIPIIPFLFLPVGLGIVLASMLSGIALFSVGVLNAKMMKNDKLRGGLQILIIGLVSAFAGFLIGLALKVQ